MVKGRKKVEGGVGIAAGEQLQRKLTLKIRSHSLEEKCIKGKLRQSLKRTS